MSSGALETLRIEHLRGSVRPIELTFERGKKLTIVYGENGTGKSTICDAFDFIGKGKVGSLENRGLGQTSRYWPSVGKRPADVAVSLQTSDAACRATIGRNGVVAVPSEHRPRVEVLRRAQILSLIEAKPADRYAAIKRFIDVSGVEASEATLRALIRDIEGAREMVDARVQENRETLQQFWEAAGKPGSDSLSWAAAEANRDPGTYDAEIASLEAVLSAFSRLADYPERIGAARKDLADAQASLRAAEHELNVCLAAAATDAEEVADLLQAAKRYFDGHPDEPVCPLCESAEHAAGLAARVGQRLEGFAAVQQAQADRSAGQADVQRATQRIGDLLEGARAHVASFQQSCSSTAWPPDVPLPTGQIPTSVRELAAWLADNAHLPAEWKKARSTRDDRRRFLDTLARVVATADENAAAQGDLDALVPRLRRALKLVEDERRRFTDSTLAAIADEVGRLYDAVHPGEGLSRISLALDPAKRASLEIGASLGRQPSAPPQAYFSDSHLDTLGVCIFLALAGLDAPANTILVLDDVLASVDEPHVDWLIEMLHAESAKFRHCVLTTHHRPWKQRMRWGWLKGGQCHFVELTEWTVANGLTLIRSVPDVDKLRHLLAAPVPDPRLVRARAGAMLDAALDFLTLLYACPLPRTHDGHYTLGELLAAVDERLRQALEVEVRTGIDAAGLGMYTTVPLAPFLEEIARICQARSVDGANSNRPSFEPPEADALAFGRQVLALMDALTDESAGWPRNDRSGSYWATAGETRRLYPLTRPG